MEDTNNAFAVFKELPLNQLHLSIPAGCAARAQIIGEFLAAKGFIVGRAWVLPADGNENFPIPPEMATISTASFSLEIKTWDYHVVATSQGQDGKPLVFDPLFFDGPVSGPSWQNLFPAKTTSVHFLSFYEAPRFRGEGGSCYWPVMRDEYGLDDSAFAQAHIEALGGKLQDPSYTPQPHKPLTAPASACQHLAKRNALTARSS